MKMFEVGGCIRDELLGVTSKDIDFTVVLSDIDRMLCEQDDIEPFEFMRLSLLGKGFEIFLETPEFLTVRARFPKMSERSNITADFVLARKEAGYSDNRRPDTVEPGTLMDDLRRRDFTMNAIAKDTDGTLIDPFNGRDDIKNKMIRAVGNPEARFKEDALRIVRAMRFVVTKGFRIEQLTRMAMTDLAPTVANISAERVREELTKMFNADPRRTITILGMFNMFPIIFDMGINFQPTMKERVR